MNLTIGAQVLGIHYYDKYLFSLLGKKTVDTSCLLFVVELKAY